MCGIAGAWVQGITSNQNLSEDVLMMADTLVHRGPDDSGAWSDLSVGISISHRRLSVLDLSQEGRQPMESRDKRYVIVFNGEIYNHEALRSELSDVAWRGHSDTEVMLEIISCHGIERALEMFSGMFAFALWDRKQKSLCLARDRLGEKPLYYCWASGSFLFGSELKALRAHPSWREEINRDALSAYISYGYVPSPLTIYDGVFKLPPGCLLYVTAATDRNALPRQYWFAIEVAARMHETQFCGNDEEAVSELELLLRDTIAKQCIADVHLGAFLSGGSTLRWLSL